MATETKSDTERALDEVKREVIESRNLVIKTDNQLKNLYAELKGISKRQEDFQKRSWISSGAAYLAFVGLCLAGVIAVTNARASSANGERDRLEKQVAELKSELEKQKAAEAERAGAERAAVDVYRMLTQLPGDERLKGVDALAKLDPAKVNPFLRQVLLDRATALRKEVGANFLERGRAAFRRQDWPGTLEELKRVLAMNPLEDDAVEASFYVGDALFQLRKYEESIPYLLRFVQGDKKAKFRDFAMQMLVWSYDAVNQRDKASEVAREAAQAYPTSDYASFFKQRLSRKLEPTPTPAANVPAPVQPAPGPGQPAAAPAAPPR
jgi:tetratricopeptide (TPR) repeat protein